MERRLRPRKRVSINVYLSRPGRRVRRCKASNLSASGVFVDMESLVVRKGTVVELVFTITRGSIIKIHRLPAIVARVSEEGAGMMLNCKPRPPLRRKRPTSP